MDKDPFSELIGLFREEGSFYNEPSFFIGVVKSALPNIQVATNGIILEKSNLMIDKWLLDRHNEAVTYTQGEHTHDGGGHTTGDNGGDGTHSHTGGPHNHNSKSYVDIIQAGDKVVMLREGDMFYIISKVVSI